MERQSQLTKPPGSLGQLEDLAVQLAAMQGKAKPTLDRVWISVFAADHGIAEERVSAFPQAVTRLMLRNFVQGGAAISVLALHLDARLEVVDVGVAEPLEDCKEIIIARAGKGTANFSKQSAHKSAVIARALNYHAAGLQTPMEILRHLGGFEIAALTGAYLEAASLQLPSLVDGFISSVAALLAVSLQPVCSQWLIFAHRSAEPGHRLVLDALDAQPILDLSMRLGEGSGAAVALPILRAACLLHSEMATFAEVGIPTK